MNAGLYVSGVGRQLRAPLIVVFFAVIAIAAVVLGDNHSVRLIKAADKANHAVDTTPLPLESAVSLWRQANGCSNTSPCPRPVIVAAAGGASRAAYFMATVLGYLIDSDDSSRAGLDPDKVRNRLFAISGVSGGSVGAVSSGDFLTADFLGFAFNDMVPFAIFRDRAAILEDSLRKHYDEIIANKGSAPAGCQGLECPFFSLRPTSEHWIPLLILNGTSEATGGRIITTILSPTYDVPPMSCPTVDDNDKCRIFVQADRFHDLLSAQAPTQGWIGRFERFYLGHAQVDDVRLSTAAHNSARFPLVSPAGTVRNKEQLIVDRIGDGGYFENYGALSAKELALAIHTVDPSLSPLVVVISNDPDDLLSPDDDATRTDGQRKNILAQQKAKARTLVSGSEPVTDLVTPIKTIANARTAHGLLGVAELDSALRDALPQPCQGLIQVRVWPEPEEEGSGLSKGVSMSWWLSAPIQEHLHRQTEAQQTGDNTQHLAAILKQMVSTSNCSTSTRQ